GLGVEAVEVAPPAVLHDEDARLLSLAARRALCRPQQLRQPEPEQAEGADLEQLPPRGKRGTVDRGATHGTLPPCSSSCLSVRMAGYPLEIHQRRRLCK